MSVCTYCLLFFYWDLDLIYLFVYLSIYLFIHLSIYLFNFFIVIFLLKWSGPAEEEREKANKENNNNNYNNSDNYKGYHSSKSGKGHDYSVIHIHDNCSENKTEMNNYKIATFDNIDDNNNSTKSGITASRPIFQKASLLAKLSSQNVPKPSTGVNAYFKSAGEKSVLLS